MSERHEMRVNAAFGRLDLMDDNHFRFARQSGLPPGYFDQSPRWGRIALVLLVLLAACVLP